MTSPSNISRRTLLAGAKRLATAAPFLSLMGCDGVGGTANRITLSGATMGTRYRINVAGPEPGMELAGLSAGIDRILGGINERMSVHRPQSELSLFNAASATDWMPVSRQTYAVVSRALEIARLSGGAFDVTVGPSVNLWGFGPGDPITAPPSPGRIEAVANRTGYQRLDSQNMPTALYKSEPALRVDLSGIAKGFAVDRVARYLERNGATDYLVEIGGEIRVGGRGSSGAWRIGIENPVPGAGTVHRVVRLGSEAIATSGDYRIFFEQDGRRYPHIIDPRTGMPVAHDLASVTVIAPTTMDADAWSTALMVLGPEEGIALAKRNRLAAFFIVKTGKGFVDRHTPAFEPYLAV